MLLRKHDVLDAMALKLLPDGRMLKRELCLFVCLICLFVCLIYVFFSNRQEGISSMGLLTNTMAAI